mgnify:CR=1 FL=1
MFSIALLHTKILCAGYNAIYIFQSELITLNHRKTNDLLPKHTDGAIPNTPTPHQSHTKQTHIISAIIRDEA